MKKMRVEYVPIEKDLYNNLLGLRRNIYHKVKGLFPIKSCSCIDNNNNKKVKKKKKQSFLQLPTTTDSKDEEQILRERAMAEVQLIRGLTVKQRVDAANKIIETFGFAKDDVFNDKKWKELFSSFGSKK